MALTTIAAVKEFLNKTDTAHDSLLEMIVDGVSARMENYTGRVFDSATYTDEPVESPGYPALVLDRFPIITITTVVEIATTLTAADYRIEGGRMLVRLLGGRTFKWATGTVFVTYDAGYATPPADLTWACIMQSSREYGMSKPGGATLGLKSVAPAQDVGESTTYEMKPWLPQVEATMMPYRVLL